MTRDKAIKVAIRQRMAETGEPYSVARRAVADAPDAGPMAGSSPGRPDLPDIELAEEAAAEDATLSPVPPVPAPCRPWRPSRPCRRCLPSTWRTCRQPR